MPVGCKPLANYTVQAWRHHPIAEATRAAAPRKGSTKAIFNQHNARIPLVEELSSWNDHVCPGNFTTTACVPASRCDSKWLTSSGSLTLLPELPRHRADGQTSQGKALSEAI
ncbi:uncharacterized protein TRIVIDRAFT_225028 [Trichoderma virens Gv29-8]|uniref:Uncharacterized protein n=1 Tax=Hypocrea virens (strain Gv29-8 / FGSC 10586) TaxID=413071 RepID=G9N239_HYPVG|nr:uncharacterized protein TRIVIDRAFT_225028 [Trichoderma virens Gv29-8]EHK19155.1 hypothetical protein TRIVIDRAFT_225028 [Trichoderma virens Gv29-8]